MELRGAIIERSAVLLIPDLLPPQSVSPLRVTDCGRQRQTDGQTAKWSTAAAEVAAAAATVMRSDVKRRGEEKDVGYVAAAAAAAEAATLFHRGAILNHVRARV